MLCFFLSLLPNDLSLPSIYLDDDADLTMDWYKRSNLLISIMFGYTGILYLNNLIGEVSHSAEINLEHDDIPDKWIQLIKQVVSDD